MRTEAFEHFVHPAEDYPQIWRIILGVAVAAVVYLVPVVALFAIAGILYPERVQDFMLMFETADTPNVMLLLLGTFFFMGLAAVAAAGVHRRGLASLIGPFRPACRNFSRAVVFVLLFYGAVGVLGSFFVPGDLTENLDLVTWASYLPLAVPLLLIQTGSEELVFRGYLQQALAARFKSAIVWMIFPSVLFGLAHFDDRIDPQLTWLLVAATGLFGLAAADLTRVTGNLGAAIGFHFANNFFALFLVAIAGQMSGLSLFLAPFTMEDVDILTPILLFDMVIVVIAWIVLRRWLAPET